MSNEKADFYLFPTVIVGGALLLIYGDYFLAGFLSVITLLCVVAYDHGYLLPAVSIVAKNVNRLVNRIVTPKIEVTQEAVEELAIGKGQVLVGVDTLDNNKPLVVDVNRLGSVGVYGITGSGKSTFLKSMLHCLIENNDPEDVELVIADLKEGLSFRAFDSLPHLKYKLALNPEEGARLVYLLVEEMERRATIIKSVSKHVTDVSEYHEEIKIKRLAGYEKLPVIFCLFDEIQELAEDEEAINGLIRLAKLGRAYNITILASTQLPKVDAIATNLSSQFSSFFVGHMSTNRAYGSIAEMDKEIYTQMGQKEVGKFLFDFAGETTIIKTHYVHKTKLARDLDAWSNPEPKQWDNTKRVEIRKKNEKVPFKGSDDDKILLLNELIVDVQRVPTYKDFLKVFSSTKKTYYNNRNLILELAKDLGFEE